MYDETPILIPVNIFKALVGLVAHKLLERSCPNVTDSEALQGWLLKFGEDSKRLIISVGFFVDRPANQNPPWAAYRAFMSGCLLVINKCPVIFPVGVRETW